MVNNCDLFNVEGIQGIKQLTNLNLNNNKLLIIKPVSLLVNLISFSADFNFIQDLNSLTNMKNFKSFDVYTQTVPSPADYSNYLRSTNSTLPVQDFITSLTTNLINEVKTYEQKMINKYKTT